MVPLAVSAVFAASGLTWLLRLGFENDRLAPGAGLLFGGSLFILGLVGIAAMLLSHAPWGRNLMLSVTGAHLLTAVALDWTVTSLVGSVFSLLSLAALSGPALTPWLRRLPPVDAVGTRPMILSLGLIATPTLIGLGAYRDVRAVHVVATVTMMVLGWAYATGHPWGLWSSRLLLAPLGIWAGSQSSLPWSVAIHVATVVLVIVAWTPEAGRAIRPLYTSLPGPRHGRPAPEGGRT